MITKTQIARWSKKLDKRKNAIGKERDRLTELIDELEEPKSNCEDAHQVLEEARDALSK